MPSPTILALPQKLTLTQGNPLPLPRHYNLSISSSAGLLNPNQTNISLFYGEASLALPFSSQQTTSPQGLNSLAHSLAVYAGQNGLWGKTVPCIAVALGGPAGTQYIARSNAVDLTMPVAPCTIVNPFLNTAWGSSDTPNPLRLPPPNGRRLYFASDPSLGGAALKAWYVTPDNRFETNGAFRGFDRFTFWLSLYGVAIKDSTKVFSGEALAPPLGAYVSDKFPSAARLKDLVAAAGPTASALSGHLMWTGSRVVVIRSFASTHKVREWTIQGDMLIELLSWIANQSPDELWNIRKLGVSVTPKFGSASTG